MILPVTKAAVFMVLVARATMVTIENPRGDFLILKSFFRRSLSALSNINYKESETLIMNI